MGIPGIISVPSIGSTTPYKKDILDVTAKYAEDRPFSFLKAIYVLGIDVPKEAGAIPDDYQDLADDTRYWLNLGKLLEAPGKFLKNSNTLRNRTIEVIEKGLSWDLGYQWIRDANAMVNPTTDMTEFALKSNIYPISKASFAALKGINGCAMVFGFGNLAYDSLKSLYFNKVNDPKVTGEAEEIEREKAISVVLKLAYEVSLFAIGVLTVLSFFFAVVIPSFAFLICSAGSVVFHITRYFYENIGPGMTKIEHKGKV